MHHPGSPRRPAKVSLSILPLEENWLTARRLDVRTQHLDRARERNAAGTIPFAGATMQSHDTVSFNGSVIVVRAESADEARQMLSEDVYVSAGVWNLEAAQILPFKTALTPKM